MGVSTPKYSSKACFQCLGEKKEEKNPQQTTPKNPNQKTQRVCRMYHSRRLDPSESDAFVP